MTVHKFNVTITPANTLGVRVEGEITLDPRDIYGDVTFVAEVRELAWRALGQERDTRLQDEMPDAIRAFDAGHEAGARAAFDFMTEDMTTERAAEIVAGYHDGTTEVMSLCPMPLSGEWGGESMPEIGARIGVDLMVPEYADQYDMAFNESWWDVVLEWCQQRVTNANAVKR